MFEQLSEQFENTPQLGGGGTSTIGETMNIDVADTEEEFVVTADLPGFDKEEIDVTVSDNVLSIEAMHESQSQEKEENYIRQERSRRSMSRSVRLPEPIDESDVSASYKNGVLTVTLPKSEPVKGRDIEIQ